MRVLVIDDDPLVRATLKIQLERRGDDMRLAADGRSGLRAIETEGFDLMIVDIFMPEMDGLEIIRAARARRPNLPILVISGFAADKAGSPPPNFLAIAVRLGAIGSLRKPFRPHELDAAIEACVAARPSPQEPSETTADTPARPAP